MGTISNSYYKITYNDWWNLKKNKKPGRVLDQRIYIMYEFYLSIHVSHNSNLIKFEQILWPWSGVRSDGGEFEFFMAILPSWSTNYIWVWVN